jgi:hypothetical protein
LAKGVGRGIGRLFQCLNGLKNVPLLHGGKKMDSQLSEEHGIIQRMAEEFAENKIAPVIDEYERKHRFARVLAKKWPNWVSSAA